MKFYVKRIKIYFNLCPNLSFPSSYLFLMRNQLKHMFAEHMKPMKTLPAEQILFPEPTMNQQVSSEVETTWDSFRFRLVLQVCSCFLEHHNSHMSQIFPFTSCQQVAGSYSLSLWKGVEFLSGRKLQQQIQHRVWVEGCLCQIVPCSTVTEFFHASLTRT